MNFSLRLRSLRIDVDKTQKDMAGVLEISQQQYELYENGKRELPLRHLITLAKYYNVSLDYLAGVSDTMRRFGA